jgi:predicted GNAT superfamily acetyltransferase
VTPPLASHWTVRALVDADRAAVVHLNAENQPALAPVNAAELDGILACGGHYLVATDSAGAVQGFLLSFLSESRYDDSEINELRRRIAEPFLYICQVAVARTHRGQGIGRALYDAVTHVARERNVGVLCCDVNLAPANPESLAFHHRLGFTQFGEGTASNGFAIAFLMRRIGRPLEISAAPAGRVDR